MKLEPKVAKSTLNTTIYHSKLKALFDKLDIQQENEPSVLSIISNEIKLDEMYNVPINPHWLLLKTKTVIIIQRKKNNSSNVLWGINI